MNNDEMWTNLTALFPNNVEVIPNGNEANIKMGDKEIDVVYNEINNSFIINGKSFHFDDVNFEVINTLLVPVILQELDGNERISY